jgi:hypothetical protein
MIWLSWRQFRVQTIVAGAALVVVAIACAGTGPHLVSLFDSSGLATCRASCSADAHTLDRDFPDPCGGPWRSLLLADPPSFMIDVKLGGL